MKRKEKEKGKRKGKEIEKENENEKKMKMKRKRKRKRKGKGKRKLHLLPLRDKRSVSSPEKKKEKVIITVLSQGMDIGYLQTLAQFLYFKSNKKH